MSKHPHKPAPAPAAPTEPVTPAPAPTPPPPAPAPAPPVAAGTAPASISGIRLVDVPTGATLAQFAANAPILIDLGKLGTKAQTYTIVADASGAIGVGFVLVDSTGATRVNKYRGLAPWSINGRGVAAVNPPASLRPGQYRLILTPYGGFNSTAGTGTLPGAAVTIPVNVVATSPDPGPTPEPRPDTTLPTERAPETEWRSWTAGRLLLRRGVTYPATVGQNILNNDRVLEVESGTGPLPVIDASQCNGTVITLGHVSHNFRMVGTPRIFNGGTDTNRDMFHVRGTGHTLSAWAWGGNKVFMFMGDGSSDVTIDGGGTLGPCGEYFIWFDTVMAVNNGLAHVRPTFRNFHVAHPMIRGHICRMYGFNELHVVDCIFEESGSPFTSCTAFRPAHGDGILIEATSSGSCRLGPCQGPAEWGPLNKGSAPDPHFVSNITVGPGVAIRQHVYLMNGASNVRFAGTADNPITWELGNEQIVEQRASVDGTRPDAWGKPKPTGSFEHVRTRNTSGSGRVAYGDLSGFTFTDVLVSNPAKGWVNRPYDKASMGG